MSTKVENLILGSGVIGTAIAYEVSKENQSTLVIDKRKDSGLGTTHAAGGIFMYNKAIERPKEWHIIASKGIQYHKELEKELKTKVKWHWTGRADVSNENDRIQKIKKIYKCEQENGAEVKWLQSKEIEQFFLENKKHLPEDFNEFQGYINMSEGWVSPIDLCKELKEASTRNGVQFKFSTQVEDIKLSKDKIIVKTKSSEIFEAKNLIIALGSELNSIKIEGVKVPTIIPVKGQSCLLKNAKLGFDTILYVNGIWCVQRPQGVFIGATTEEGNNQEGCTLQILDILTKFTQLFPKLKNHSLDEIEYYHGFRPKLQSEVPYIEKDPKKSNLFWAVGVQNNGVLLAPYVAKKISEMLFGKK